MRCEIGRLSQRETRPSPGLPVARTIVPGRRKRLARRRPGRLDGDPRRRRAAARCPRTSPARAAPPSPIRAGSAPAPASTRARTARAAAATPAIRRSASAAEANADRAGGLFRFPSTAALTARTGQSAAGFAQKGGRSWHRRLTDRSAQAGRASSRTRSTVIIYHPLAAGWRGRCVPTGISANARLGRRPAADLGRGLVPTSGCAWPAGALLGFALHAALARHRRRRRRSRPAEGHAPRRPASWSTGSATMPATSSCISPSPSCSTTRSAAGPGSLAIAAGASHIVQTNHAETQRRAYLWWAYGVPWLRNAARRGRRRVRASEAGSARCFGWLGGRLYLAVQPDGARRRRRSTRRWTGRPAIRRGPAAIRRLVRRASRRSLALRRRSAPIPGRSSSRRA